MYIHPSMHVPYTHASLYVILQYNNQHIKQKRKCAIVHQTIEISDNEAHYDIGTTVYTAKHYRVLWA